MPVHSGECAHSYLMVGHLLCEATLLAALLSVGGFAVSRLRRIERENIRLQRERRIVVEFMHEMAIALEESPSREKLMERIVRAAIESTGALSACLYERNAADMLRPAAIEGLFPPQSPFADDVKDKLRTRAQFLEHVLRSESIPMGHGLIGGIARRSQGELITDGSADPRLVRHDDPALAVSSFLAVPLRFNQRCFGVIALANPAHGGAFSATDYELVLWLAEQASLALHNADFLHLHIERQQLDLDLSLASSIQKLLLPSRAPLVPGLDIELRYVPAQRVGGDLYDLIELPGGRLGVAIADVSGKGIPASLVMTSCRSHLRQIAPRHASPARVLCELNSAMLGDMQQGMYVTVCYAIIDPAAEEVLYARAGHELPLLVRRDESGKGSASFLDADGMPIGMVPNDSFEGYVEDRRARFGPGDHLLLYTDGITEAPNLEDREFSGARLADVAVAAVRSSAAEMSATVMAAVEGFAAGRAQRDDYTLVCIRRL